MNCAHTGCRCEVEPGTRYCSDYCEEHGDHADDHACECGHDACATAATV
jgi:hypothetical protein